MSAAHFDIFVGQFIWALVIANVCLLICNVVPRLRRKKGTSYSIASAFALGTCLIPFEGSFLSGFVASILAVAILYMQFKRALKQQSMEANTIISY
jgi:hypothetical protein